MRFRERSPNESLDQYYQCLSDYSNREDLVLFVNACFAATGQKTFYVRQSEQRLSIDFLHRYVLANYRPLYARVLACGVNHFSRALIIQSLLAAGAPQDTCERAAEGKLIQAGLRSLPANRVYKLFKSLQKNRVNNRRTRAVIKSYLSWRREPDFDAVKYGNKLKSAMAHAHVDLGVDINQFLFQPEKAGKYQSNLLNKYREAHYSAAAIYELPFTVAESLAIKHRVPRDVFLSKIQDKMTPSEKLRLQRTSEKALGKGIEVDLSRMPLTKLALYALSLTTQERVERGDEIDRALRESASRVCRTAPWTLGKVAAVLDCSRSSGGSRQTKNRPLGVAIAANYLLSASAKSYQAFWTLDAAPEYGFDRQAKGQTCLADRLIDALEWEPDLVVVVSDGFENDPPMAVNQVAEVYQSRIRKDRSPEIVHANPVFDSGHFSPRGLGAAIATVGLRDAEALPMMLGFAQFASGNASLAELKSYLDFRAKAFLGDEV